MQLNKRVTTLILPVLVVCFLLIFSGIYVIERTSVRSLAKSSQELEATELADRFDRYSLIARSVLASILQSDALRSFLDTEDGHFKALAINGGLNAILNSLSDFSEELFSVTFIKGGGKLEYYFENSLDPFAKSGSHIGLWVESLFGQKKSFSSIYFPEQKQIAYCRILDRLTLKPTLDFYSDQTIAIIVALKLTDYEDRKSELTEQGYGVQFLPTGHYFSAPDFFESRRTLPGFGTLVLEQNHEKVEQKLRLIFWRLCAGFLLLTFFTLVVLKILINRYVIHPIHRLEHQICELDLEGGQCVKVATENDEIGNLSRSFGRLYEKLQDTYRETRELAEKDSLTRLYNRRIFHTILEKVVGRARYDRTQVALLYIDIDNFKYVNDQYGHTIGDMLLQTFALRLHNLVRGTDIVMPKEDEESVAARLAGDEFAVIIHGFTDETTPDKVARRILSLCQDGFIVEKESYPVTLSIGVATFPRDAQNVENLIINADSAMYESKKSGKNAISFYSEELAEHSRRQQSCELALKQLDFNELSLHYMPIYDAGENTVSGFEALVRWTSKTLGEVSPNEFIPLAESLGMHADIDLWVIERAFRDSAALRTCYGENVRVSINISAAELAQEDFVARVLRLLQAANADPRWFIIEITETFYQDPTFSSMQVLSGITEAGFQLAIDDFGFGFTSMMQLVEFPLTIVKIDRTFVEKSLAGGRENVLEALVEFCHKQGLKVTAEGVEQRETAATLTQLGCDFLQGFYFSPPLPLADVLAVQQHGRQ